MPVCCIWQQLQCAVAHKRRILSGCFSGSFFHRLCGINLINPFWLLSTHLLYHLWFQEPNNLRGVNSFRYNGLVQEKTVGVEASADGKSVTLVTKKKCAVSLIVTGIYCHICDIIVNICISYDNEVLILVCTYAIGTWPRSAIYLNCFYQAVTCAVFDQLAMVTY